MENLSGYEFWRSRLNSAQLVVAPMVDQSELPWRLLSRRYGAELCYTPMFHAGLFGRDPKYRSVSFTTCVEDRPLIVQFCANDPETLLTAARLVEDQCDAVDLNLGCPQGIARRGHYGSFLQDEWNLIHDMVSLCASKLKIPVTVKIRIFEDVNKTVEYAQMLEKAGCKLLTVHGRTRQQKGPLSGLASWAHIKAVKENVSIPVFANGNIQYLDDVWRCIKETGVDGVMTAEGNLHNPALFRGVALPAWQLAEEYMQLVATHPCTLSSVRAHLFKLLYHILHVHTEQRSALGSCRSLAEMSEIISQVKTLSKEDVEFYESECKSTSQPGGLVPYWICQPYVRPSGDASRKSVKTCCWHRCLEDGINVPKKEQKKKLKKIHPKATLEDVKCLCGNAKGVKCAFSLCRTCCKRRITKETSSFCPAHKRHRRGSSANTELTETDVTDTARVSGTSRLDDVLSSAAEFAESQRNGDDDDDPIAMTDGCDRSEDNEETGHHAHNLNNSHIEDESLR